MPLLLRRSPAHPDAVLGDDQELVQIVGVVTEQESETGHLQGELGASAETEQDHPDVWLAMAKDQLAEITVVGDKHASFGMGKGKDLDVGEAGRIVGHQPGDVVAE